MSECTLRDLCLHRDDPWISAGDGTWVRNDPPNVHLTALDEPIHDDCAETMAGAVLKVNHAFRNLGRAIWAERRSLILWMGSAWVLLVLYLTLWR